MRNCVFIFLIFSFLTGCGPEENLIGIVSIPSAGWPAVKAAEFGFSHKKGNGPVNLLYQVQYDPEYSWENIWLSYQLVSPRGDTLIRSSDNLFLFEPSTGKPLGKGCRERLFINAYFLKGIRLKDTGTYRLYVRHQMRCDSLKGIQALGIRLKNQEDE